ncbi:hypothetical protein EON63_08565 [archaeon]|nr:MAG: hypothetical protein EON63_08565 [archaeon]
MSISTGMGLRSYRNCTYVDLLSHNLYLPFQRLAHTTTLLSEMDQLRQTLPSLIAQLRAQQENAGKLSEDAGRLAKIHRAMYVRRILDITASLMKQGNEVAR